MLYQEIRRGVPSPPAPPLPTFLLVRSRFPGHSLAQKLARQGRDAPEFLKTCTRFHPWWLEIPSGLGERNASLALAPQVLITSPLGRIPFSLSCFSSQLRDNRSSPCFTVEYVIQLSLKDYRSILFENPAQTLITNSKDWQRVVRESGAGILSFSSSPLRNFTGLLWSSDYVFPLCFREFLVLFLFLLLLLFFFFLRECFLRFSLFREIRFFAREMLVLKREHKC